MKTFLVVLAAAVAVFAHDLGQMVKQDALYPHYICPMVDIDFYGHNLDLLRGIGSWQECGA